MQQQGSAKSNRIQKNFENEGVNLSILGSIYIEVQGGF